MKNNLLTSIGQRLLFLICHFLAVGSIAQSAVVRTVMQPKSPVSNTQYFKGRIDDMNDVTLALTCKNGKCDGELVYVRSKDRFVLKGEQVDGQLQLQELNQQQECTGYLNGNLTGERLQLYWESTDGTIGNEIALEKVYRQPEFPSFCGNNKWINSYSGKIRGESVDLILQRVDNDRILGIAFYKKRGQRLRIEGELLDSDNLHLRLFDDKTTMSAGSLRGIFKQQQNLTASFYDPNNTQSFVTFDLKNSLPVNCLEYADYYTNYDFLFPKNNSKIFNEMMTVLTRDWLEDCRYQVQQARQMDEKADLRARQRAYNWTEIEVLSDELISGMLTYDATWRNGVECKTFNFDVKNGTFLELPDLFKKDFDYRTFVKNWWMENRSKNNNWQQDPSFQKWLYTQQFNLFTLNENGIVFYSDFHIIYDRQAVFIPYKKLKKYIRKKAVIRKFL